MFLACCFPLYDTDLFWHLKTGELILETWSIPGHDLYTYTDSDKRWIDLHWGFQVGAALVYRLGGANLLILVKAAILTVALGIGCWAGGVALRNWQRVLCWLLPAITISGRGYERPEIITLVCLAGWLWVIPRLEQRPRWIWLLPVLQVFWINCHALYILGLVVGGCYAADSLARWVAAGRCGLGPAPRLVKPSVLFGAGGLCAAAAFVNPYFAEGAAFPFILFRKFTVEQEFYSARIGEFQMPIDFLWKYGFVNLYLNAEVALWCAAAGSFVWLAWCRRFNVFRTLLFAAFSYLAWKASRNTNVFSLVAGFVLAENLGEILGRLQRAPNAGSVGYVADAASIRDDVYDGIGHIMERVVGVLLLLMIAAVVTGEWNHAAEKIRPFGLGETRHWYAHDAARFMQQPGFPRHVFASHFGVAAVYSYHNGPQGKVFMDGRLEVCTQATFQRFNDVSQHMARMESDWVDLLRDGDGGLPAIMLDTRGSLKLILGVLATPGWRLVYADKAAAVFFDETTADKLQLPAANLAPLLVPPEF